MTYVRNHYVPIWYQRRFMAAGQSKYYRLDLHPEVVKSGNKQYTRRDLHHWGPANIFAEGDLYTTRWGNISNTEIEQFFFGNLDQEGQYAVEYFAKFQHPSADEKAFKQLLPYMSVQKLRTPKGLAAFEAASQSTDRNQTLILLQEMQNMFCAIWTECVWQIADASNSPTKFIISDHPVTVYNRACPHLSKWCQGCNDPDIRFHATHTFFPLSLDKILILTNLSWIRNPYQNEMRVRPNPNLFRTAMFNFTAIQTGRRLSEDEVLQINLVTKRRAYRYVAAAEKEWLYPEKRVSTDHWKKLGDGYLFMPEPRLIHMGGEIVIGYDGGGGDAFSEYGHKPWEKGYEDKERYRKESKALYRFQAEWALKHGPKYIANSADFGKFRLREDSEQMMQRHREVLKKCQKKRG